MPGFEFECFLNNENGRIVSAEQVIHGRPFVPGFGEVCLYLRCLRKIDQRILVPAVAQCLQATVSMGICSKVPRQQSHFPDGLLDLGSILGRPGLSKLIK